MPPILDRRVWLAVIGPELMSGSPLRESMHSCFQMRSRRLVALGGGTVIEVCWNGRSSSSISLTRRFSAFAAFAFCRFRHPRLRSDSADQSPSRR